MKLKKSLLVFAAGVIGGGGCRWENYKKEKTNQT